jgi:hypothetical protein
VIQKALTVLLVGLLAACSETTPPASQEAPPVDSTPPAPKEAKPSTLTATVTVVDLSGAPLPRMAPIVTQKPNAFDQPVETGSATDHLGKGTISFPADEHLFLRAWDPTLNYFPNNFYEVLAGGNQIMEDLVIQMVPAAALSVQLFLPDDNIAANMTVGLMLFHPTRGPWWPAEGTTNADGFVTFAHLPAGEYVLRFKVVSGARLEYRQTALPPGDKVDLGVLTLR